MKPKVSIILLNYNNDHFTVDCLKSLEKVTYPNIEPIVVDNGSKPESLNAVKAAASSSVVILESQKNMGFTGGNNFGVKYALDHAADYIILLNNDTIVAPDMFDILIDTMEKDPSIGVTGPMIYYYDAPKLIWSVGGTVDWKSCHSTMVGLNEEDNGQYGEAPMPTDFVTGCAMLARREVWEKIGGLDENFFIYYEETEWCVRATRAGYKIVSVPKAVMWHKIGLDARATTPRVYYYMTRNRLLFARKTHAGIRSWLGIATEFSRTLVSWSVRPKWKDRRPLRRIMLRAIKDFSIGKYGQQVVG